MRLSRYFLPVMKETPADAQIVSHKLMLRAGLIRQTAAGIYAWLPLGLRVLKKIERIVREEQDRAGAVELLMPTVQSADLWRQSGRFDAYGPEMLRFPDRHGREMLYGPTNEEMITTIFLEAVRSYRDLPRTLYHIQWKFRDEVRPRFGVMRGREFLMKDAYSFDLDDEGMRASYEAMFVAYLRTFARMGLQAVPVRAPTGPIGGDLSHEFHILADTGESALFYDAAIEEVSRDELLSADTSTIARLTGLYAMEEEEHAKVSDCPVPPERLRSRRGIEVGHIFAFGSKYSKSMGLSVQNAEGAQVHPQMGSYGVGVSRLMGAIIEASHDEAGIVWPDSVAPFRVGLINMRADDGNCASAADELYGRLRDAGIDTLYDDRDERGGAKFATMDLIGLPLQLVIGPKGVEKGIVELKRRATGEREELSLESAMARLSE
ncbi:proline--tRNA ligase [Sphingosinicella sp. CPCC 101087]|uniref:proline--tRNA ligase n=1 Tax=Sphingosinicella sp. CPCC 101087 TaxID=2497754 RepID=UPI00101C7FAB|nr:proline--tRNA ligase [Sphingosinicella sp. CPCC 101087]